jgi:alpha-glucoside transport system permease protein
MTAGTTGPDPFLAEITAQPDVLRSSAEGLNELVGSRGQSWHLLTAGAFVSMVVPTVVFLALQRFFVRGLLAGSVKG